MIRWIKSLARGASSGKASRGKTPCSGDYGSGVTGRHPNCNFDVMAEWRFGRGWSESELNERLRRLYRLDINFPLNGPDSQEGTRWHRYYSESIIGYEKPGAVEAAGPFLAAWEAIGKYRFSDPDIVEGHYDPQDDLRNRPMLLEIKILGLRYLCGVRVRAVREERGDDSSVFGFRYDTLDGHIEVGSEWFLLTKIHATGEIWFRITASWRPGKFPNWWSRLGFAVLAQRYQLAWHRLAYLRLRDVVGKGVRPLADVPHGKRLVHTGPEAERAELWTLQEESALGKVIRVGTEDASWKKQAPAGSQHAEGATGKAGGNVEPH